ncbi:hypothetical protein [Streptomyces sp. NPDC086010]|uniref:hypothetical protein n=1 Tax=Streptomyces sp. NPDC086010 TaxID=3365745 RepID=UPI0037CF41AD
MRINEACLTACAVVVLLVGTAACTSERGEPFGAAEPRRDAACGNGTCTWFNVDQREVLTGVADKQHVGRGGGRLTRELRPLHTPPVWP